MQFGIGILGKGWTIEKATEDALASEREPRPNMEVAAEQYARKIAAETILAEPMTMPDLSDEAIVRACSGCAHNLVRSEAPTVREAFLRIYGNCW